MVKEMETDLACCLFVLTRSVLEGGKECALVCFALYYVFLRTSELSSHRRRLVGVRVI